MDAMMKVVMRHCEKQMTDYQNCVKDHPYSWPSMCDMLRLSVARCSDSHPDIKNIKVDCSSVFERYNKCIRGNPTNVEKCTDVFETFNHCVEVNAAKYERKKT